MALLMGVVAVAGCRQSGGLYAPIGIHAVYPAPPTAPRLIQLGAIRDWQDVEPPPNRLAEWLIGPTLGKPVIRRPGGMCTSNGVLYVCDVDLATVYRLDFENRRMDMWPDPDRAIGKPVDVATGTDGSVFIADTDREAVLQMDPAGKVLRVFRLGEGEKGRFRPIAVAVDGDSLYVANVTAHNVVVFSVADGRVTNTIGRMGDQAGEFHFPADVVVADARLYVLDMMNCRVQVFSLGGQWHRSFGAPGNRPGFLGRPKRVSVGPDGTIFVVDAALQRVHVFDAEGRALMAIDGLHPEAKALTLPNAVCVDALLVPALVRDLPMAFKPEYLVFLADQVADPRIEVYAYGTFTEGGDG
jgi:DNA-binding beta-propeller fold protein YncE